MDNDDMLSNLEGALNSIDPMPAALREQAIAAASWVAQHGADVEELLAQVAAGQLGDLAASGMRGASTTTSLDFSVGTSECSLSIEPTLVGVNLSGVVTPPPGDIEIVVPGTVSIQTTADTFGRFDVALPTAIIAALRFADETGATVQTPLFDLV